MPFDHILGQQTALWTLKKALASGKVHHAMRFEGPPGVGKNLTALALAQALVCSDDSAPLGCGTCSACVRATSFCEGPPSVPLHPDVILIKRGLYPPSLIGRSSQEIQDISVDQIRTVVLPKASFAPHEGKARVFIVHEAERLSVSAANALLKTLEEPGNNTHFILLVEKPARMLSTIQSRTLKIRFTPLPPAIVEQLLVAQGIAADVARAVVPMANGSMESALALATPESNESRDAFQKKVGAALRAKGPSELLDLADDLPRDKAVLRQQLEALAARFALSAKDQALEGASGASRNASRYEVVLDALQELDRNASPALLIENMMIRLRTGME